MLGNGGDNMIKKILALLTASAMLLTGCSLQDAVDTSISQNSVTTEYVTSAMITETSETTTDSNSVKPTVSPTDSFIENPLILRNTEYIESLGFNSLNDTEFHDFIEDAVYSDLVNSFSSDDYYVENVEVAYISKEYLDEVAYNSLENLYFGYKLSEIDKVFQGEKYIFTLNENGQTDVVPFEEYDDTYEKVVRNVAIGTGVILLCVTVSVATGGAFSMIFATSGAIGALTDGAIDGAVTFAFEYAQTGNPQEALKKSTLAASEGYMFGAITGAVMGKYLDNKPTGVIPESDDFKYIINGVSESDKNKIDVFDFPEGIFPEQTNIPTFIETPVDFDIVDNYGKLPWQKAEELAHNIFGGDVQVAFKNGEKVAFNTKDATRPDIIRKINDKFEAIEVKHWDLNNTNGLCKELKRQVEDRVENLPENYNQRVVLDVTGRGYTKEFVLERIALIQEKLNEVYYNLPINVVGI